MTMTIMIMTTAMSMNHTIIKSLLPTKKQSIDTSILFMITKMTTTTIMHMTMIIMITITDMITDTIIIIMVKEKRERVAPLLTCSKISQAIQMAKLSITFINNLGLSQTPLEHLRKRPILTNSLSKKSWLILRLSPL